MHAIVVVKRLASIRHAARPHINTDLTDTIYQRQTCVARLWRLVRQNYGHFDSFVVHLHLNANIGINLSILFLFINDICELVH